GYLVDAFRLISPREIDKIKSHFVCCFASETAVVDKEDGFFQVRFKDGKGPFTYTKDEFMKMWDKSFIVAPVTTNVWCEKGEGDNAIYVIYSYHDEEFEKWEEALRFIFSQETDIAKLAYIDELGLIPYETIKRTMDSERISEEEAFSKVKKSLETEVKNIKNGGVIYDSNPSYNKLYKFLAKYKIECFMEDLKYDNWYRIIKFDELNLPKLIQLYFLNGDIDNYVQYKRKYIDAFRELNIVQRDKNFIEQIVFLMNRNPEKIFFTIRGIGHLGLEEKLAERGIKVRYIILGAEDIEQNLANQQVIQIYRNLNVNIEADKEFMLILKAELQEMLRIYIALRDNKNVLDSTREANNMLANLEIEEVMKLYPEVKDVLMKNRGKLGDFKDICRLIYTLVEQKIASKMGQIMGEQNNEVDNGL
ncbi:MAG: hypothetical protein AB7E08_03805, partial [Candidatus Omnitrophota bacterium]